MGALQGAVTGCPSLLEGRTQKTQHLVQYRATIWPEAGECVVSANSLAQSRSLLDHGKKSTGYARMGDNEQRVIRRGRARLRRYAKANSLRFLSTLTYAEAAESVEEVQHDWRMFVQRLRRAGYTDPWARVFERGKRNTQRLHGHFATSTPVEHLAERWGHGFVAQVDHGEANPWQVAAYLTKYLGKEALGSRMYDVARGFQPRRIEHECETPAHALDLVSSTFYGGAEPSYSWASTDRPDWVGPPSFFFAWEGR